VHISDLISAGSIPGTGNLFYSFQRSTPEFSNGKACTQLSQEPETFFATAADPAQTRQIWPDFAAIITFPPQHLKLNTF